MNTSLLSDLFGYTSIGCWLFAQFPQVLENIRRQSCEGLALPFLFNWLLGDITNLIGCILTHQLPFQTVLATYFVMVDMMLFSQYFYYSPPKVKEILSSIPEESPVRRLSTHGRRCSTEHDHHYRELSNAAANVAIAAALAVSEEELLHPVQQKQGSTSTVHRRPSTMYSEAEEAEDEVDDAALAALADSFHSEGGRKRISWSRERYSSAGRGGSTSRTRPSGPPNVSPLTPLHTSLTSGPTDGATGPGSMRGRPLQRQIVDSPIDVRDLDRIESVVGRQASRSVIKGRRNSRASQRSVGLVFLGVWALFGIGTFSRTTRSISTPVQGTVLSEVPQSVPLYDVADTDQPIPHIPSGGPNAIKLVFEQSRGEDPREPSSERIIGRIFAWACTTLYLTSRLPQIWKNFVRKSVEGLSMYLFVFAFLGNTFYVMSILSSPNLSRPQPAATAFLLESMPYLLGSGGTLLFDVTIVSQSFLYRHPPSHTHTYSHRHSSSYSYSHSHPHRTQSTPHATLPHQRTRSSYSRSRTESYNQIHKNSSLYGSTGILAVPEEERSLLRSTEGEHDLESGANDWTLRQQQLEQGGQSGTRRRKDASEGGDSEETVS
ncbi:uncharacterized protein FOMMEDRAFT_141501 [Fomitiporia mediterranea MF3/22]|uniref:uncharacterized protein n=1 Tax=Fomitiporia mediterranea (strain MF3/22) TaxID=694068 RepID=UPI000440922C|nr:uncharacterized protein FOMMEDRAFT_141501 [Fomitiporia mediterranea MF3/22]EJD02470.1 hypothetical protein FOMMEDRAFT_141501 [Fomitiporia mediterranea MF3/22]